MKYVLRLTLIALVLAGCEREPLGYDYIDDYNLSVLQGGDGGVHFMPPLLHSSFSGEFAPDRNPVIVVCAGVPAGPCEAPVAILDATLDDGEDESEVVRVEVTSEKYVVNWKASGEERGQYRIYVIEDGESLAYIDVALTRGRTSSGSNGRGVRIYGAQATREFSGTLPIAFRMEVRQEPEPANGLMGQYFEWSSLVAPDFALATPILERLDPTVDFVDPVGDADVFDLGQNGKFMARWTGFLVPETEAFYTLCILADDGVRLRINGFVFINQWVEREEDTLSCASSFMEAGSRNAITVEWYHNTGGAAVQLLWQAPLENLGVIPSTVLWPN